MKIEDFKVGEKYTHRDGSVAVVLKVAAKEVVLEIVGWVLAGRPFVVVSVEFTGNWRPYVPPRAPLVRWVYAVQYSGDPEPQCRARKTEAEALGDPCRVGPVVRVDLPITASS